MKFIADFHLHSKYSRATSPQMNLQNLDKWAKIKGLQVLGTSDFTHPQWLQEIKQQLIPAEPGLYKLKYGSTRFILTAEISCIYCKNKKTYKNHLLILAPTVEIVDQINKKLNHIGNLSADGRPILGLDARELVKIVVNISQDCLIVPAHCLLPDTFLHCNPGLKMIKDVSVGDLVYTHKGNYQKVQKIYKRFYKGKIINIKPYYFRIGLKSTPEHPFYAIKTRKNCAWINSFCKPNCSPNIKNQCRRKFFKNYYSQWIQARDIEKGDVLIFPRFTTITKDIKEIKLSGHFSENNFKILKDKITFIKGRIDKKLPNIIKVNKGFCRLVGYYISEGCTDNRDSISFCFKSDEKKYIQDIKLLMKKNFGLVAPRVYKRKNAKSIEIIYFSKILAKVFSILFYNHTTIKRAHTKILPSWTLNLPIKKQVEIFKGWWRGDGGATSSRELMNQMKIILLRLGIIPSISEQTKENFNEKYTHKLGNRIIKAKHNQFIFSNLSFFQDTLRLLKSPEFKKFNTKLNRRHGWIDKKYIYLPVRDIEVKSYKGEVYNLEVEKDNSYLSEFATVHNCWTPWFSLFGSRSGFDNIKDCFEDELQYIFALETGLSSDPEMNWRVSQLDKYTLLSNSDAHCVHPNTDIYAINGRPEPIKNLNSSRVLAIDFATNLKQIEAKISKLHKIPSPSILYKIATRTKKIITTPEHRFFILENEIIKEKKASELKKNDLVACLRRISDRGKSKKISSFNFDHQLKILPEGIDYLRSIRIKKQKTQKDVGRHIGAKEDCIWIFEKHKVKTPKESFIDKFCEYLGVDKIKFRKKFIIDRFPSENFPKFTNEKFCQVLGYILGDGGVEHSKKEIRNLSLTDKDLILLGYYQNLIKEIFNIEGSLRKKKGNSYNIRYPSFLAKYFQQINFKLLLPSTKRQIPDFIFELPIQEISAFLKGLYDAEGTVGHHFISLTSSNLILIKEIQVLLLKFGLSAYIYHDFEKNKRKWRYHLNLYGHEQLKRFADEIGFNSISKKAKLSKYLSSLTQNPKNSFVDSLPLRQEILKIKKELKPSTYDIPRRLYYHLANQDTLKRNNVKEFIKIFSKYAINKTIPALEKLKKFVEADIIWEPIEKLNKIKSNCKFVYDLTIPSYENYVANGFITHNSPQNIGREANVFETELSYFSIIKAIKDKDPHKFLHTIEFFPQQGKYHYDGHKDCNLCLSPAESKKYHHICPQCNRPIVIGVLNRVEELADRQTGVQPQGAIPYKSLVPLKEIIAHIMSCGVNSKKVEIEYNKLIKIFDNEFNILITITLSDLIKQTSLEIAQAIIDIREGRVDFRPGYDGVYGKIILNLKTKSPKQAKLF